jgi:hypothetical protein
MPYKGLTSAVEGSALRSFLGSFTLTQITPVHTEWDAD